MPVKVRCLGCQKVLNAPDRARGKAIKCPNCETKIRIPAGNAVRSGEKEAVREPADDDEDFLANLDLTKVEDTRVRLCPRCATEVTTEDVECPECGIDLETKTLSKETLRKRGLRGPDPAQFYSHVTRDARRFLRNNKNLAIQTVLISLFCSAVGLGCVFMVWWCETMPPQVTWGALAVVILLSPVGWTWFLHTEIIRDTLERKDRIKKVNVDFFQNVALGIKLLIWSIIYSLPIQLVTGSIAVGFLFMSGVTSPTLDSLRAAMDSSTGHVVGAGIFIGLGFLPGFVTFPIVMVHMSMPVTYRGWLSPRILPVFFRNPLPPLYWSMIAVLTMVPSMACVAVGGLVVQRYWDTFSDALQEAPEISTVLTAVTVLSVLAILWVVSVSCFGFAAVYNMRMNGTFAHYFKRDLDLITEEKEVIYVPKTRRLESEEPNQVTAVWALALTTFIGNLIYGMINDQLLLSLLFAILEIVFVWIPISGVWRVYEKAGESGWASLTPVYNMMVLARVGGKPKWWGLLLFVPCVGIVFYILICIGIAEKFKKGAGFGVGLAFLGSVFFPILGFGSARYGRVVYEWKPPEITE